MIATYFQQIMLKTEISISRFISGINITLPLLFFPFLSLRTYFFLILNTKFLKHMVFGIILGSLLAHLANAVVSKLIDSWRKNSECASVCVCSRAKCTGRLGIDRLSSGCDGFCVLLPFFPFKKTRLFFQPRRPPSWMSYELGR